MDYDQAEREFWRIEALHRAGSISEETYRAQLRALRVTDEYGRTWMIQERTGQWFVYHQDQWMAATPPGRGAGVSPAQPPPVAAAVAPPATRARQARPLGRRPGCRSMTVRMLLWALLWLGVAWAVSAFVRGRPLWAYGAVGLGALGSLVLWVRLMTRHGRATRSLAQGGTP